MKNQSLFYRNLVLAGVIALVVTGSFFAGTTYERRMAQESARAVSVLNTAIPESLATTTADFAPFWKAWNLLNEKALSTTTDQEKVWGAIEGLASAYGDPYTVFFPPVEAKNFDSQVSGNFEGVGMEVGVRDDVITIIAPLKDSPADRAGVLAGDKVYKIDDKVTTNLTVDEAVTLIRGPKGTSVKLTLIREGATEPIEKTIVRDQINIPTTDTELRKDGVFVIKLYNFSAVSPNMFRDALRKFVDSDSDRLILDLRGNPGGYLDAAVDMASFFLPAGKVIVRENYGEKQAEEVHKSLGYNVFTDKLKMVVLINAGSASASEILAGALRDNGVAKIVGTKSFGKGSVQELVKLTPTTSLKVTIAKWLTPNGISISDSGLTPDVEVKITADDVVKGQDPQTEAAAKLLLKD
ncbi:MAG: S41 family peptidase [Candidatus Paceibacterota bacterium]|jgi:carboxyl-terminal processing protease